MRNSAFIGLALAVGLALGACSDEGDHNHDEHSCSGADATRSETIIGLIGDSGTGATVFANNCGVSSCHGPDGSSGPAPDLADEVPEFTEESLTCLLLTGEGTMPSQGNLSDQELADVLAYVQATF